MLLAELEVFHSRSIVPTRRVALGRLALPTDPAPGFGGLLLGAIVAVTHEAVDEDLELDLHRLVADLERGRRIPQPQLRYRFQVDRVGLKTSTHQLHGDGDQLDFDLACDESPVPQLLAALYAAAQVPPIARPAVFATVRRGLAWHGPRSSRLLTHLATGGTGRYADLDPVLWALRILGFEVAAPAAEPLPSRREIQKRFRSKLREAHPDHGGRSTGAADRIADLSEARRILTERRPA